MRTKRLIKKIRMSLVRIKLMTRRARISETH